MQIEAEVGAVGCSLICSCSKEHMRIFQRVMSGFTSLRGLVELNRWRGYSIISHLRSIVPRCKGMIVSARPPRPLQT